MQCSHCKFSCFSDSSRGNLRHSYRLNSRGYVRKKWEGEMNINSISLSELRIDSTHFVDTLDTTSADVSPISMYIDTSVINSCRQPRNGQIPNTRQWFS